MPSIQGFVVNINGIASYMMCFATSLLIPPSWDKSGYSEIVAPVWRRAVEELKSATRICVVGYSIPETDAFFKYLITMALAGNHQLYNLIVVDYRAPIFNNHPLSLNVQGYTNDVVRPLDGEQPWINEFRSDKWDSILRAF